MTLPTSPEPPKGVAANMAAGSNDPPDEAKRSRAESTVVFALALVMAGLIAAAGFVLIAFLIHLGMHLL